MTELWRLPDDDSVIAEDVTRTAVPWPMASETRRRRYVDGTVRTWTRPRQDVPWTEVTPTRTVRLRPAEEAIAWVLRTGEPVEAGPDGMPCASWQARLPDGTACIPSGGVEWGEDREAVLRLAAGFPVLLGGVALTYAPVTAAE